MNTNEYVSLIIDFINSKYYGLYTSKFKASHIYNYCLLFDDNVDIDKINFIIDYTINMLLENDYLVKFKSSYMVKHYINIESLSCFNNSKVNVRRKLNVKYS